MQDLWPDTLARSVTELLSLVRYQVPELIRLEQQVPEELHGHLPLSGLRQALLNLVLNAAQALGEQPGTVTVGVEQGICGGRFPTEAGTVHGQ